MVSAIKKKILDCIVEILIALLLAVSSILWGLNAAQAATDQRVNSLEKQIEVLRQENRDDHRSIMEYLRKN